MNTIENTENDLLPEYDFDYSKAKPNRFAVKKSITVTLEPDIAEVFTNSEAVNKALRAILLALPNSQWQKNKKVAQVE
jgi:hypothetical protein